MARVASKDVQKLSTGISDFNFIFAQNHMQGPLSCQPHIALATYDRAVALAYSEAFQKGYAPEEAKNDPELESLHTLPQFQKLARDFGTKSN